jgi:hypothetical protein
MDKEIAIQILREYIGRKAIAEYINSNFCYLDGAKLPRGNVIDQIVNSLNLPKTTPTHREINKAMVDMGVSRVIIRGRNYWKGLTYKDR